MHFRLLFGFLKKGQPQAKNLGRQISQKFEPTPREGPNMAEF
jgi:hypothetical protein